MITPTTVDTHLRVRYQDLPKGASWLIKEALSIENGLKKQARREHVHGWQEMPDRIEFWREAPAIGQLVMPRGFANRYSEIVEMFGGVVHYEDQRVQAWLTDEYAQKLSRIAPRDQSQSDAITHTVFAEQGICDAPPGAGKTVTILEAIRRTNQRAIVLVDQIGIAEQWRERSREHLGVVPGLIGDGVWEPDQITIAMKQTLWSKRHDLQEDGFFDQWGFVCMDECHHITAETYHNVVQKFPAYYRIGVSGTPEKHTWLFPLALAVLGPVYIRIDRSTLQHDGVLVAPEVHVVHTDFEFAFRSTKVNRGGYRVGNNYAKMMKEVVSDDKRNDLIVDRIRREPEACQLVVSRQLRHLRELSERLSRVVPENSPTILFLTGSEDRAERQSVSQRAAFGNCVIFSTIADEALDIPRLDRLHLTWPQRNPKVVRQQIGRIERIHPEKKKAIVYDYYDSKVGVIRNQFSERLAAVYQAEGLEIIHENMQEAEGAASLAR